VEARHPVTPEALHADDGESFQEPARRNGQLRAVGIRIALFGQPRVLSDDGSHEFALPRKTLNVLAYLILNRRRAPTRDTIAFALFPDEEEETARGALRRNLSYLLQALPDGRQYIDADAERVAWNAASPAHVDVIAFEQAMSEGRLSDAIAEYTGQLLPTIYDEWATADRERLRDAFHDALSRTVAGDRSRRSYDTATSGAHRLLDEDPWREDMVRQLMAIRYEAGDRAGALLVFERFAALLRREMQTEPMPETFALREAVLRGARLATSEPQRFVGAASGASDTGLPFVGRDAAMELGHAAWQSAADGSARVLFVSGEAGVGKSRFTTELVRLAEREGAFIVRGYTSSGGEQQPYEVFMDALQGGSALLDEHARTTLSDDRAARLRLFDAVRRRLSDLSRARPIVLVLEDLHWAGAPTIDLLDVVARRLDRAPVLIVATSRSDELARAHPLRALRRQLQSQRLATEITLDRLNLDDATRAARAALPATVDETALAQILAWVDGVPLLLVEAVRDLAAGRSSTASSMTSLVAERFQRLSPDAEMALIFGAVLGERFDLGTLVAATGWRDDQVLDAIGESIEHGFVRAASRAPGLAFAFTHDLVRVAALERISQADLVRTHGLVARAISTQAGDNGARAGQIARHFAAAGENVRAAEYFRGAAQYALDVFANEDARESASAGLALCDEMAPSQRRLRYELVDLREQSLARLGATGERREDARTLVTLADGEEGAAVALGRLFEAHFNDVAGRTDALARLAGAARASPLAERTYAHATARHAFLRSEFANAREAALRTADTFEQAGDMRAAMKARLMGISCLARLGSFGQAEREVEQLRPAADASGDAVLRWEFHLVACMAQAETHREEAIEDARRSLALALRIGDRYGEARARHNVATVASKLRRYDEALDQHERALAAYRDVGDAPGIFDTSLNVIAVRMFCGDYERPRQLLDEIEEDATPFLGMRCELIRGLFAKRTERFDDAERYLRNARRLSNDLGASFVRARSEFELADLLTSQGRLDEAGTLLNSALDAFATMGEPEVEVEALALSARLLAITGDAQSARERAARAAARCKERRPQSYSEIIWNLASAFIALGDESAAHVLAWDAAAACVDDALRMPAELAETYLKLPWHQQTLAYVWDGLKEPSHTSAAGSVASDLTRRRGR
jgi:DNA-binding SARP family transcriptional activator/tetratricopeptide (TPR) repeat protein